MVGFAGTVWSTGVRPIPDPRWTPGDGRVVLALLQQPAYGMQFRDVLPAMSAVDEVAEQAFSVAVVQRPVDER